MPKPVNMQFSQVAPNQAFTSQPLTNHSLAYFQDAEDFIATKVLPVFEVPKGDRTGDIYSYGKSALRIVDSQRATGWAYNKINLEVEKTGIYRLEDYGLSGEVLLEDVRFAETPIDAEIDITETITQKLMLDQEKKVADSLSSTSVITQNVTLVGNDQWSAYTTSNPFEDIQAAISSVKQNSTKIPNTLILAYNTFETLQYHPLVLSTFPWAAVITKQMVADKLGAIFGFDNVFIGKTQYTDSNLGAASQPNSYVWDKVAIVAYVEKTPRLKTRTLGWTFTDPSMWNVESWPVDTLGDHAIRRRVNSLVIVNMWYDQVIVDATCAYLIKDAIA